MLKNEAAVHFSLLSNPERLGIILILLSSKDGITPALLSAQLSCSDDCITRHLRLLKSHSLVAYIPSGANHLYFANRILIARIVEDLLYLLGETNANSR